MERISLTMVLTSLDWMVGAVDLAWPAPKVEALASSLWGVSFMDGFGGVLGVTADVDRGGKLRMSKMTLGDRLLQALGGLLGGSEGLPRDAARFLRRSLIILQCMTTTPPGRADAVMCGVWWC